MAGGYIRGTNLQFDPEFRFLLALDPDFEEWQNLAWAGALLITLTVLVINILARTVFRQSAVR